jgi:uncharacterized protein (TIGR03086 family)
MDIPAMFSAAVAEFDARVRQIGDHQWQAATPDEDWAVRDLVNHVAGEDLWAPPLLAGSTIAEVGGRFDGDVLGADPKVAWTAASAAAVQAVGESGVMDRIVHLSFGDVPGREYALQLFADHLIHAWDLARAIGADERLDAGLVASCATWFEAVEDAYRSAGAIARNSVIRARSGHHERLTGGRKYSAIWHLRSDIAAISGRGGRPILPRLATGGPSPRSPACSRDDRGRPTGRRAHAARR